MLHVSASHTACPHNSNIIATMCVVGFFTALYSLVSAWIDPNTAAKIRVLGSNFLDTLREEIGDCDIPAEYGGSCQNFRYVSVREGRGGALRIGV